MAVRALVLAASLLASLGGCDDDGRARDASLPMAAVSDAVYDAMGVTASRVSFDDDRRPSTDCASELGLPVGTGEGQAWYASQAYALRPGTYDYDGLVAAAAGYFSSHGYETQMYRKSARLRALTAAKGDVRVLVTVPPLQVTIAAGPCGRTQLHLGSEYVPEHN